MWVTVAVVLFVLNFKSTCQYEVPQPEIKVLQPRGFSVSIPHEPGLESFEFNGNINRRLDDLGEDFSVVIREPENGRWTFINLTRKLRIGDVIYYWLVVNKDNWGYILADGHFVVEAEESNTTHSSTDKHGIPPQAPSRPDNWNCLEAMLNITRTLLEQQTHINALELANRQMRTYIEQQKDARKLTISGKLPPDDDASLTASFILSEKLDLNPVIISAIRNDDGSITFEVPSVNDKLEILKLANEKLAISAISIR